MLRHACVLLAASSLLACSSGDIAVGKSQAEELKTKADGSPTGNGTSCSLDGIAWGGTGTTASPPDTPTSGTTPANPPPTTTQPVTPTTYAVGTTFPAPDGCNVCKCAADGVWCTANACTGGGGGGGDQGCTVDGKTYANGATFPSSDGCNKCSCNNGMAACTQMACAVPPPAVCTYGGKTYNAGDSFASTDNCNTCSCMNDGSIACTMKACAP